MSARTTAAALSIAAAGAAWFSARYPGFLLLLWLLLLFACLAPQPRLRTLVSTPWLGLFVALLALSWTVALDHEAALRFALLALAATLLFSLARFAPPGPSLIGALAAVIALTALVALLQQTGGLAAARSDLGTLAPALREAAATRLQVGRAFGTSALPGHFAILMVTVLPLILSRMLKEGGARRVMWAVLGLLAVAGVVATRSLAAIGVGALLLVAVAARRRSRSVVIGAALLVVAAAAVAATRTDLGRLDPLRLRLINWRTAAWVAATHPWTGVGLGGVGQAGLTGPTAAENISPFAHCTPLQLTAELGVAGLGVTLAGLVGLGVLLRRGLQVAPALALAVAAVPLHNLVDFSFYAPEILLPWAVLAGTLAARCWPPPRRPLASWLLVPVLVGGGLLAAVSWRGQTGVDQALLRPKQEQAPALLAASRWQPWAVTPLLVAADVVLVEGGTSPLVTRIEEELAGRSWVRPVSPAWAEARARLLLAASRSNEALPWAVEAGRRAPWRSDLKTLEGLCRRER